MVELRMAHPLTTVSIDLPSNYVSLHVEKHVTKLPKMEGTVRLDGTLIIPFPAKMRLSKSKYKNEQVLLHKIKKKRKVSTKN